MATARAYHVREQAGEGEAGTTLTGAVLGNADPNYESPLAGHGAEESKSHLVIKTAFERLWELVDGEAPDSDAEILIDNGGSAPR